MLTGEVARALLYARPPEWAEKEAADLEQKPSTQRFGALTAVCEAAPQEVTACPHAPQHADGHLRLGTVSARTA